MARPSNSQERKRQIVEGLLTAMAGQGYDGASVQSIAEAAGLTAGLVHYHFKSKQEILLALVEHLGEQLRARYDRKVQGASSPRARLYAFLDAYVALGSDARPEAVACWVAIGAEALRQREVATAYRRAIRQSLEELECLLEGVLSDEFRSTGELKELSSGLMSAILGSYQLAVSAQAAPKGFAQKTLRRMVDGLIAAQAVNP
jgi:TetR/AcrR family transcriptional repressor of bet genes